MLPQGRTIALPALMKPTGRRVLHIDPGFKAGRKSAFAFKLVKPKALAYCVVMFDASACIS